MTLAKQKSSSKTQYSYSKFNELDGSHPFKKAVPNGYLDYQARTRHGGTLRYFNFSLAKEMGLVDKDHPEKINKRLEKTILDTFAIIIINEYDIENKKSYPDKDIKAGTYMATRYLQLQHPDKTGKTSGDGRSVWNGQLKHKGKVWDISSSGTGATSLSPACAKYNKFFESGDPSISYGCGYSEIDEGFATLVFSEVFQENKIETERILALIEFENGFSISVRAHQNLLRPSHFFNHLKQSSYDSLKQVVDYYIQTEKGKDDWKECPKNEKKYSFFLNKITSTFAKMAARFEDDYIFCWLDWDGDNILMDGGIIDYGSIRQFGLFHYEYRYDDVDRFSTTITEQKDKAKYIVQSFAQAVDYILTREKKPIQEFKKAECLIEFENIFEDAKDKNLLNRIGFSNKASDYLLKNENATVKEFRKVFSHFERTKSSKGLIEISDGITWDAIFCMRDLLRELPQIYLARGEKVEDFEFVEIMKSNYALAEDLEINPYRKKMISQFQELYLKLIDSFSKNNKKNANQVLLEISMRSSIINKTERVTGDSITFIVERLSKMRKKLSLDEIYHLVHDFALYQNLDPAFDQKQIKVDKKEEKILRDFFEIVRECREGI